jgi:hypothetical protein
MIGRRFFTVSGTRAFPNGSYRPIAAAWWYNTRSSPRLWPVHRLEPNERPRARARDVWAKEQITVPMAIAASPVGTSRSPAPTLG